MNQARNKIIYISISTSVALIIIIGQLFYLQIIQNHTFTRQGQRNFLRSEKISSPRGNILDSNNCLLATNRPIINLYWQGSGNHMLNEQQLALLHKIEKILEETITDDKQQLSKIQHVEKYHKQFLLVSDIAFKQLSKIEELFPNHKNLTIKTDFKRFYPHKSLACHILGYLGNINFETIGKMGLEKLFEEKLKGQDGTTINTINSLGRQLNEVEIKKSLAGNNIHITIDLQLQNIVEKLFPENQCGTIILMDPADGSLVTLASFPNFDPSIFLEPIHSDSWQALQEKKPFLNRAFSASYPPGSIFKLVTTSAALEHDIITSHSTWDCKGFLIFARKKYWCNRHDGHGTLSTAKALAKSCNIMFYEIGKTISINLLAEYAQKFGLGKKTNLIFPENNGLIPTSQWKIENKGERWWPGETLSAAIGQSFLLVTPIQVACMIAGIFTGELVSPRILVHEPVHKQPLDIKEETRNFLKKSMKSVVTKGTGRRVSKVKDIEIYAKTSTAQTSSLSKRRLGTNYLEHGWFVAHFQYKNNKPLVIVILVENAGSALVATTIAKNFLIEYKKLIDQQTEILNTQ